MKNVRVRVRVTENCVGNWWWYGIFEGKKEIMEKMGGYERKSNAIRFAKAMAKRIGVPYSPEIIKLHGC